MNDTPVTFVGKSALWGLSLAIRWLDSLPGHVAVSIERKIHNTITHTAVEDDGYDLIHGNQQEYRDQWTVTLIWLNNYQYDTSHHPGDSNLYSVHLSQAPISLSDPDLVAPTVVITASDETIEDAAWVVQQSYHLLMSRKVGRG